MDTIEQILENLWGSAYVQSNPTKAYKSQYNAEYLAVAKYMNDGTRPNTTNYSKMGKVLVGLEDNIRAGAPPPPPPPPTGGTRIPTNGVIPSGGLWYGDPFVGQVTIGSTSPITLTGAVRNLTDSDVIKGVNYEIRNLTLDHLFVYGGMGRIFDAVGCQQIAARNCTIDKTSGMKIAHVLPGCTILATRNKHKNIQGPSNYLSAFFKVAEVQTATIEVSWNEIINEYNLSHPEDIISLFKSAFCKVHNNYIQHNSTPGNPYNESSQGTITVDYPDGVGPLCHDIEIWENQMVDTVNAVLFPVGAYNCFAHHNRAIQDGKLPNGEQMGNGYSAWAILNGVGPNCHMHDNVSGFVNRDGVRYDWHDVLAAPEGRAAEIAKNITLPNPITRQMELDEWPRWTAKLAANGVSVGA